MIRFVSGALAALLYDTGEQYRLIEHPKWRENAVREALRVTSPAPIIGRSVLADLVIGRHTLRAGERNMVLTWTANNLAGDYRVDQDYIPQNRQLWFGLGGAEIGIAAWAIVPGLIAREVAPAS